MRGMSDDGVQMAEQEQAPRARASHCREQIRRVRGTRALDPLDLDLGGQEGGRDRNGLLCAGEVAGGRGDPDQRFELALGATRDLLPGGADPGPVEGEAQPLVPCSGEAVGSPAGRPTGSRSPASSPSGPSPAIRSESRSAKASA